MLDVLDVPDLLELPGLLLLGTGVAAAPVLRLVLVRLRSGRWREAPRPNQHLPPPAGHKAVVAVGSRTLECPCGWCWTVPWPPASRRLNGARLDHYWAVEQQRTAQRLGVDTDSLLERVVAVREAARHPQPRVPPGAGAPEGRTRTGSGSTRSLERARSSRRALEARRASAIARVEASRVLPQHTGGDG